MAYRLTDSERST